jgi:hypothetical protein
MILILKIKSIINLQYRFSLRAPTFRVTERSDGAGHSLSKECEWA